MDPSPVHPELPVQPELPVHRELAALLQRLWTDPGGGAVTIDAGSRRRPRQQLPGRRLVEQYVVLPSVASPRFLLPAGSRPARLASLVRYDRLRSTRTRVLRWGLAGAVQLGAWPAVGQSVGVYASEDVRKGGEHEHLLTAHLAQALGVAEVHAAVGVHELDPNHKPTLQLFDRAGTPLGFAKIGWNGPTRALVRNEAISLRAAARAGWGVEVPAVLHSGAWRGLEVTVVEPLPTDVRRHRSRRPPPATVAPPATAEQPLEATAYWRGVHETVREPGADAGETRFLEQLRLYAERLQQVHGRLPLSMTAWHGDWVPWNLAWSRGRLHVIDWEHAAASVPAGFDLLHWAFQLTLVVDGGSPAAAVAAVDAASATDLATVPVPPERRRATASLYLLEMALRTYRLKHGGGSWNARLAPGLAEVLAQRDP